VYNFLVGTAGWPDGRGRVGLDRIFEFTDTPVSAMFRQSSGPKFSELSKLPTLFASETRPDNPQEPAHIGEITGFSAGQSWLTLEYRFLPHLPAIPNDVLWEMSGELQIEGGEFSRGHWAVKDADLYQTVDRRTVLKSDQLDVQPVFELSPPVEPGPSASSDRDSQAIFVIHGHDHLRLAALKSAIVDLTGRNPIVLHEQPDQGRSIIEKFEEYAQRSSFAVALFTPDDTGARNGAGSQPRARQNVVFEAGYFIGKLGRSRVMLLKDETVDHPSDRNGVIYVPIDPSGRWRVRLATELRAAGIECDAKNLR
jgi:predicted nucleotide-binding protein